MNIISASRRTDIPAFFGEWFSDRINEGFCEVTQPFNGQKKIISLKNDAVIGFVFWSKNYIPFLNILKKLKDKKYQFYLNYTVNNYPKKLENLFDSNESIAESLISLSKDYTIFWRYDPIYVSKETDFDFHLKNFEFLSSIFKDKVKKVIINYIQEYKKVTKRLNNFFSDTPLEYVSILEKDKIDFTIELKKIANKYNISINSCDYLLNKNMIVEKSHCVDKRIFDNEKNIYDLKISPTFKGCNCFKSVDIGFYNSCKNDCCYCYATI